MEMTFQDYINNPMGKNNSVISNREMHRTFYTQKFNQVLLRENGKIDYNMYKDNENYYIHIKVPSETVNGFYYDIVVKFYPSSKTSSMETTLTNYFVKFYSNDPAFVYTFAHAFIKNKVFLEDLESKMSKEAVKKEAKEKNPKNEVGYVKTLYFGFLFMKNKGFFNKISFATAPVYKKSTLIEQIMNADEKIALRQEAETEQNKKKKKATVEKAKKVEMKSSDDGGFGRFPSKIVNTVGSVGKSKVTSRSSGIKSTKRSKKI